MTSHRPTEERRAQILAAARDCFLAQGYHATKVDRIARAAGLSKGAVYFHFESKRALLEALVEAEFGRARAVIEGARDAAAVDGGLLALLSFLGAPEDPRHRFFLLTGELAVHDAALSARLQTHHRHIIAAIEDLVRRWAAAAALSPAEVGGVAVLLKAMADGLQGSWALGVPADRAALFQGLAALTRLGRPTPLKP